MPCQACSRDSIVFCVSGLDITACKEHIRQLQARRERRSLVQWEVCISSVTVPLTLQVLVETSALLVVTGALLVVTRSY